MDMTLLPSLLTLLLTPIGVLLLSLLYDPRRFSGKMTRAVAVGTLLLVGWNLLPLPHLGVNPLSILLTGALGLPGLGLTAFLNLLP